MGLSLCNVWVAELRLRLFVEAKMEISFTLKSLEIAGRCGDLVAVRGTMMGWLKWYYGCSTSDAAETLDSSDFELAQQIDDHLGTGHVEVAEVFTKYLVARSLAAMVCVRRSSEVKNG